MVTSCHLLCSEKRGPGLHCVLGLGLRPGTQAVPGQSVQGPGVTGEVGGFRIRRRGRSAGRLLHRQGGHSPPYRCKPPGSSWVSGVQLALQASSVPTGWGGSRQTHVSPAWRRTLWASRAALGTWWGTNCPSQEPFDSSRGMGPKSGRTRCSSGTDAWPRSTDHTLRSPAPLAWHRVLTGRVGRSCPGWLSATSLCVAWPLPTARAYLPLWTGVPRPFSIFKESQETRHRACHSRKAPKGTGARGPALFSWSLSL